MKNEEKRFKLVVIGLVVLLFILSACQNQRTDEDQAVEDQKTNKDQTEFSIALPVLDAELIASKDEVCSNLVREETDAWRSRNVEELEQVYTDDVIHYDGGPAFVGIDEVTRMAENMWIYFPKWEMEAGEVFISDDLCFGEWRNWNIFSFEESDPGVEYDWLEFNDDGIYFWRLFYDAKFQKAFSHPERIDANFLTSFTVAWSDQDEKQIARIYDRDAHIEDSLFGRYINGVDEIMAFAGAFIEQFPDAQWRMVDTFGEEEAGQSDKAEYPFTYQGGIMEIELPHSGSGNCTILAAILLAPDEDGKVISQKMFYEPQSLISCGLAQ